MRGIIESESRVLTPDVFFGNLPKVLKQRRGGRPIRAANLDRSVQALQRVQGYAVRQPSEVSTQLPDSPNR